MMGASSKILEADLADLEAQSTGKIAVKVINDYGDEVMKVFVVD